MFRAKKIKIFSSLLVIAMLILVFINPTFDSGSNGIHLLQTAENRIHENLQNNSISDKCVKYADSLRAISKYEASKLKGMGHTIYFLTTGFASYDECDTCHNLFNHSTTETKEKYFLTFKNFTLKQNSSFYINNGKYYIENFVVEKDNGSSQTGHTATKEINVRLGVEHLNNKTFLLLPITKKQNTGLKILFYLLLPLSIFFGFRIFIYMPFRLLMNIAAGEPFVPQNIKYLKIIGWTTIGITLFVVIFPLLIKIILNNTIPKEISYPFWAILLNYKWQLFIGMAILIVAKAFETGHKLQQEQDLTV
jgi:Protein of unknown function (DUF2975)